MVIKIGIDKKYLLCLYIDNLRAYGGENMDIRTATRLPTGRLLTNAYMKRKGKPFLASAVGANITIFPVDRTGQVIGEGKLLPADEFCLEVIHPYDLKNSEGVNLKCIPYLPPPC